MRVRLFVDTADAVSDIVINRDFGENFSLLDIEKDSIILYFDKIHELHALLNRCEYRNGKAPNYEVML